MLVARIILVGNLGLVGSGTPLLVASPLVLFCLLLHPLCSKVIDGVFWFGLTVVVALDIQQLAAEQILSLALLVLEKRPT